MGLSMVEHKFRSDWIVNIELCTKIRSLFFWIFPKIQIIDETEEGGHYYNSSATKSKSTRSVSSVRLHQNGCLWPK